MSISERMEDALNLKKLLKLPQLLSPKLTKHDNAAAFRVRLRIRLTSVGDGVPQGVEYRPPVGAFRDAGPTPPSTSTASWVFWRARSRVPRRHLRPRRSRAPLPPRRLRQGQRRLRSQSRVNFLNWRFTGSQLSSDDFYAPLSTGLRLRVWPLAVSQCKESAANVIVGDAEGEILLAERADSSRRAIEAVLDGGVIDDAFHLMVHAKASAHLF